MPIKERSHQFKNLFQIFDHELKLHPGVLLKSANEMSPDFQEEYDDSWIDEFEGMAYEDLPYKTNRHFSHLPKNKRNEARQAYHVELRSKYRKEWLRNNKKSTLDWFQKSTANAICGYDIYFCSKSHFVSGPRVRIPGK